jgi:hypothetical protein
LDKEEGSKKKIYVYMSQSHTIQRRKKRKIWLKNIALIERRKKEQIYI